MHRKPYFLFLCCLLVVLVSCSKQANNQDADYSKMELMLGTVCKITITDGQFSQNQANEILDACFAEINTIEQLISRNIATSEVSQVNAAAGKQPVVVSKRVFDLVKTAVSYAELTGGAFNPAIGPLVSLWGIATDHPYLPTQEEIEAVLPLIDYHDIILDAATSTVFLARTGMSLDLGGIGKGYSADAVKQILESRKVKSALVNLGGNILVVGNKADGQPWRIGLQDPTSKRGEYFMTVSVTNQSVVTSGPYERFFEQDGVVYHHILDPKTGYPADTDIVSSTMISDSSTMADAFSTATFVLGLEKSMELLHSIPTIDGVFLLDSGEVAITQDLLQQDQRWRIRSDAIQVLVSESKGV